MADFVTWIMLPWVENCMVMIPTLPLVALGNINKEMSTVSLLTFLFILQIKAVIPDGIYRQHFPNCYKYTEAKVQWEKGWGIMYHTISEFPTEWNLYNENDFWINIFTLMDFLIEYFICVIVPIRCNAFNWACTWTRSNTKKHDQKHSHKHMIYFWYIHLVYIFIL